MKSSRSWGNNSVRVLNGYSELAPLLRQATICNTAPIVLLSYAYNKDKPIPRSSQLKLSQ